MNKLDFLNAICSKPIVKEIDGIEVQIKALTVMETQQLSDKTDIEAALELIYYGLVEPKLNREDLETLKNAKASYVMKLAKAITEISGMSETESPTLGNI